MAGHVVPVVFNNCLVANGAELAARLREFADEVESGERDARVILLVVQDMNGGVAKPTCFATAPLSVAATVGILEFAKDAEIETCRSR